MKIENSEEEAKMSSLVTNCIKTGDDLSEAFN